MIDPLVDGVTGIQTLATDAMERQVVQIVKSDFPQYEVKPFSAGAVAELPLILIGTFTPINLQGKRPAAMKAFGSVVNYGLKNKRLAVKFAFRAGSASFATPAPLNDQWLKELAKQIPLQSACLEVAGHSSRGGPEPFNERVSLQRAEYVKQRLSMQNKELVERLKSQGYGSRHSLIGTGKNDASDSLDQRIEFKPTSC